MSIYDSLHPLCFNLVLVSGAFGTRLCQLPLKLVPKWLKLAEGWFKLVPRWLKLPTLGSKADLGRLRLRTWRSKMDPGTKSMGARRHQGGTKEAPRMHQGCTKDASGKNLHIDMGPRAHHFQIIQFRTYNGRSICFHLTRSGHKARRIISDRLLVSLVQVFRGRCCWFLRHCPVELKA